MMNLALYVVLAYCAYRKAGAHGLYAGCDDNIHYGSRISKQFVDVAARGGSSSDVSTKLLLHNNEAGRLVSSVCGCDVTCIR